MYSNRLVLTRDMVLRDRCIDTFPMTAPEFCQKWIPILYNLQPTDRGYKAACIRELAQITSLTERAIKGWGDDLGSHPDSVKRTLYWANMGYAFKYAIGIRPNQDI